jgi:hypothetical protein
MSGMGLIPTARIAQAFSVEAVRDWVERGMIASHNMPGRSGRVMISESELERIYAETFRPRIT